MKKLVTFFLTILIYQYCFGQQEIEVSFDRKVILSFNEIVDWHELGRHEQILPLVEGKRCVLQCHGDYGSDFVETNLIVGTVDGLMYNFSLVYNNIPKKEIHPISKTMSINNVQEDAEITATVKDKKAIFEKILAKNETVFGNREKNIAYKFLGVYNDDNEMYFHFSIENESDIPYDIDLISFFIEKRGSKARKKSTSYKAPKFSNEINFNKDVERVDRKERVDFIYTFDIFSLNKDKLLVIQIEEKGGDRDVVLEITPVDIDNSTYL